MITVLTHNGKMPSEGGIRSYYQVGNLLFPVGGGEPLVLMPPPPAPEQKPVVYEHKPQVLTVKVSSVWSGVHCPNCGDRLCNAMFGPNTCYTCDQEFYVQRL
jgi:hypothetical protein